MQHAIDEFIQRNRLLEEDSVVVVGVSGGPDSMALLHYLKEKRDKLNLTLIVAHMDHMFRGEESAEDARFVIQYCNEHAIEIEHSEKNLPLYIEETGESPQQAARKVRYQFFTNVMVKRNADCLALAHHGDDQVETMLMNMVRGTSLSGLSGIPFMRPFSTGHIIRPLLNVTKEEILLYCEKKNIPYRVDPSNTDSKYTRNRFRKHVLPFLKEENRNVHEKFQFLSESVLEDEAYLEQQAEEALENVIVEKCDNQLTLSIEPFLKVAIPLQRRGIHLILNYLYPTSQENIMSNHIKDCLQLIMSDYPSGTLHLPDGLIVRRSYEKCTFTFETDETGSPYRYPIHSGETYPLPVGNLSYHRLTGMKSDKRGKDYLVFASTQVQLPLIVRTREDGDRIRPVGVNGSRKVKDIFIDEKVPKHLRDVWPVVTDSTGKILWIPGLKHAELPPGSEDDMDWMFLSFENTRHEV